MTVSNRLPGLVRFDGGLSSTGCAETFPGLITCDVGTLAGGSHTTLTLAVTVDLLARGALTNVTDVSTSSADEDVVNNVVTTLTTVADTDGDGMPDVFEWAHALAPGVDDADDNADRDPLNNLEEYIALTDVNNSNSFFHVEISVTNGAHRVLRLPTSSVHRTYRVDFKASPGNVEWRGLRETAGGDGVFEVIDTNDVGRGVYRTGVELR